MIALEPEELHKLIQLRQLQAQAPGTPVGPTGPTDAAPPAAAAAPSQPTPDQLQKSDVAPPSAVPQDPQMMDKVAQLKNIMSQQGAAAPEAQPAVPQISHSIAGDPYDQRAADLNKRADALATPQVDPGPQNAKQASILALRNIAENFGRYGAPGGYYGQEAQRQAEQDKQNEMRLAQAKDLRGLAENQQSLGMHANESADLTNYRNQETATANDKLAQQQKVDNENRMWQQSPDNPANSKMEFAPKGSQPMLHGKPVGPQIPDDNDKQLESKVVMMNGKPEMWSVDMTPSAGGKLIKKIGDAPPNSGGASALSVSQGTDANGNSGFFIIDKPGATAKPVTQLGPDGKPTQLATAAVGNANAKSDVKQQDDFVIATKALRSLEGLSKNGDYASDQAMGDAFFNIIKPGSGARMNQTQINNIMEPGPLKDKMLVWVQKLDQGQPMTPDSRAALVRAARIAVESKRPIPRAGNTAAPAAPAGGTTAPAKGWSAVKVGK